MRGQNTFEPFQCILAIASCMRKCFKNQAKDIILQDMDALSLSLHIVAARKETLMLLFLLQACYLAKAKKSSSLAASYSYDLLIKQTSHCNLIRVLLNHRNMPKSNSSNNRNNNKHPFVHPRPKGPQMP